MPGLRIVLARHGRPDRIDQTDQAHKGQIAAQLI